MVRRKRVPPGTRIDFVSATPEERRASIEYINDRNLAMQACKEIVKRCERDGLDPVEYLSQIIAHNLAVDRGINRARHKGVETNIAKAAQHAKEIARQLEESDGKVKPVVIDRQSSGKKAASEHTVRRVKRKTAPGGSR